jgi:hypothetical protein
VRALSSGSPATGVSRKSSVATRNASSTGAPPRVPNQTTMSSPASAASSATRVSSSAASDAGAAPPSRTRSPRSRV